ncbi:MAG: ParB/RepB/Spo0J family partition protein [Oscillospiraceae bacterium]|nr:ParB/RepB/Spo0J family partition protein [Oscillospiraceae bacterium]
MKPNGANISLTPYDDIFSTEESRNPQPETKIQQIPVSQLFPFKNHPFSVTDDKRMEEMTESVKSFGIMVPIIARPLDGGGYEIISGHRRVHACELAGIESVPVLVRDLDDDEATILMVDSNLQQRDEIPPTERGRAYQMKLEALKHQGKRQELTSDQIGQKSNWAIEQVAEDAGKSKTQVQRFIRLNSLNPELQEMVDEGRLAFTPAVELSYLKPEEQRDVAVALEETQNTPSLSQAQRIRKMSENGEATKEKVTDIMMEEKKPLRDSITLSHDTLKKYFPKSYSIQKIEQIIIKLLENYLKRQREKEQAR